VGDDRAAYALSVAAVRVEHLPGDVHLTAGERRVVARLLVWLRSEVGDNLLAVWLFGSRARGEADLRETDPDRRSDVDLMVVVGPDVDAGCLRWDLAPRLEEFADEEGESPIWFSVLVYDSRRLTERRRIRSFFLQEVDRDKLVIVGDVLEGSR
jgi:predicted nucleotidyltransferase